MASQKYFKRRDNFKSCSDIFIDLVPRTSGYTLKYKEFKKKLKEILKSTWREDVWNKDKWQIVDNKSNFQIELHFFFKDEKTRIDIDNLSKPILDALRGVVYKDDTQVFKLVVEKEYNQFINGIRIKIKTLKANKTRFI